MAPASKLRAALSNNTVASLFVWAAENDELIAGVYWSVVFAKVL